MSGKNQQNQNQQNQNQQKQNKQNQNQNQNQNQQEQQNQNRADRPVHRTKHGGECPRTLSPMWFYGRMKPQHPSSGSVSRPSDR